MMKMLPIARTVTLLAVLIFCLGSFGMAQAAPPSMLLGVVDYPYLIQNHPDTAKANEILRAEDEKASKEFKEKAASLNEKEKQELDRQLRTSLMQKKQELEKPIIDSIRAAMKSVADSKGMTAVLYKSSVAIGGTDITEEVLKKLK